MVAITVILAAVIGAFVLEIGDQQETAPSTSYDTEQSTQFYSRNSGAAPTYSPESSNLTTVEITHAGGETNDVSRTDIVAFGNSSMFGIKEHQNSIAIQTDPTIPQPNLFPTLGTNEPAEFTSGDSWSIIGGGNGSTPSDENLDEIESYSSDFSYHDAPYGMSYPAGEDAKFLVNHWDTISSSGLIRTLQSGDQVNVVWTASSGGKTQTLFKYTVQ